MSIQSQVGFGVFTVFSLNRLRVVPGARSLAALAAPAPELLLPGPGDALCARLQVPVSRPSRSRATVPATRGSWKGFALIVARQWGKNLPTLPPSGELKVNVW